MTDRPQYPSYPADDSSGTTPPAAPGYGQAPPPPGYGQAPPPPGYGQVPPGHGQLPPGFGYGYAPPQAPTNGKAVAAMVLGIVSIVFCYLGVLIGPAAIVVSVLASRELGAQPPGAVPGKGMATAGLVTGIIGTVIWGAIITLIIIGVTVEP